jgi:hypothetical protein
MLFFSNKRLGLNVLLTSTVAFTGNVLAKAQECFTFKSDHETFAVETPNERVQIIDNVWENLINQCDIREISNGCEHAFENAVSFGKGVFGGNWCEVGYNRAAPQGCVESVLKSSCDEGFGTDQDYRTVYGMVATVVSVASLIAIALRYRQYRARRSAQMVARQQEAAAAPVQAQVIQMFAYPVSNPMVAQAVVPAAPAADQDGRNQQVPANDAQAPNVPERESSVQPGAAAPVRRGSFSVSRGLMSLWNSAIEDSIVPGENDVREDAASAPKANSKV